MKVKSNGLYCICTVLYSIVLCCVLQSIFKLKLESFFNYAFGFKLISIQDALFKISTSDLFLKHSENFANFSLYVLVNYILIIKKECNRLFLFFHIFHTILNKNYIIFVTYMYMYMVDVILACRLINYILAWSHS